MFGILLSAFNTALGFLVRSVIVKFGAFFALFFIVTGFISYLSQHLPTASSLTQSMGGITADIWYFLDVFGFSAGVPIVLTGYLTRFAIRRIPVIG